MLTTSSLIFCVLPPFTFYKKFKSKKSKKIYVYIIYYTLLYCPCVVLTVYLIEIDPNCISNGGPVSNLLALFSYWQYLQYYSSYIVETDYHHDYLYDYLHDRKQFFVTLCLIFYYNSTKYILNLESWIIPLLRCVFRIKTRYKARWIIFDEFTLFL